MLVTPLRDGMNLVAKEFVAARADEDGVLVLSEFAGAARRAAARRSSSTPTTSTAWRTPLHTRWTMPARSAAARMRPCARR